MKVLHVNFSDMGGGAAIAAYLHHQAMLEHGYKSKMLVLDKKSNDPNIIKIKRSKFSELSKRILNKALSRLTNYYATWSNNIIGYDISNDEHIKDADIVIIHWIGRNTISIKSIKKILQTGKPVYMFMHDMWAITGGCHYALECTKYQTLCAACPHSNHGFGTKLKKDLSYWQFQEKLSQLTSYDNLNFVTPSEWLANKVKESALFSNHQTTIVRNLLDISIFKPLNKKRSREQLDLPIDRKLLLFGADNIVSPYKGWNLLRNALKSNDNRFDVVVYGICPEDIEAQIGVKCHKMGHISDISTIVKLYSACDAFITSSIAENYPNVLIEAMACGLPCIGTDIGGIPEIIQNSVNGFIVPELTSESIKQTIEKLIFLDEDSYTRMSNNARESIQHRNSYDIFYWKAILGY